MKKLWLIVIIIFISVFSYSDDLFKETLAIDIETSGYQELFAWCDRLKLETDGSSTELKQRLYDYYKVEKNTSINSDKPGDQKITIESADHLEYFTIEKIDENYVKISGNVIISIEKNNSKSGNETHKIQADTILFNFKENYLTASGNIKYVLEGPNKTENFSGDKITFNIDNAEGLFDAGITEQQKEVGGEMLTFYFKGDEINKTEENYVLLENGVITSCDFEDPHYKIKAEKLWLIASNEWAVLNGILYIGRVPFFYIPAFLYTGDEMFFNPSFGFRSDFGYFLQTTTYFIGEKEKNEDSAFSFMQSESENKYLKLEGLYLTEDENPSDVKKTIQTYGSEKNYAKLMLDYYTGLGFYSALDIALTPPQVTKTGSELLDTIFPVVQSVNNFDLYLSIARTRQLEQNSSFYSSLFMNDDGEYSSIWLSSYLFNISLPFRYGLDFSSGFNLSWFSSSINIELWSDPDYTVDFSDRNENLDLLSFLSLDTDSTDSSATLKNQYSWKVDATLKPKTDIVKPWVNNFTITASTSLDWLPKEIDNSTGEFDEFVEDFYYPDNYVLPKITSSISGQLLPLSEDIKDKENENTEKDKYTRLQPREPLDNEVENKIEIASDENLPEPEDDIPIDVSNYWTDTTAFKNTLSYSISPDYSDKTELSESSWSTPESINLTDIDYSFRTASLDGNLKYNAKIFDNLFDLQNTSTFSLDYKEHYNMSNLGEDTVSTYLSEDKQATEIDINNILGLTLSPFAAVDYIDKTTITYNLSNNLYNYDYSTDEASFITTGVSFTDESITNHKIGLSFPFDIGEFKQTFKVNTSLPPKNLSSNASLSVIYAISSTELNTAVNEVDEEYEFDPLTINEKLDFGSNNWISNSISFNYSDLYFEQNILSGNLSFLDGKFTANSKLIYDIYETSFEQFTAGLKIYDFNMSFSASDTYDYSFDTESGWQRADETSFIPTSLKAGLNLKPEVSKLWKNRIDFQYEIAGNADFNLIRYTDSYLNLSFSMMLKIFEFLDLEFKSTSENKVIYRYVPEYCDELGVNQLNIFSDLFKSFNLFSPDDRYESNFNLKNITIGLIHDLHDWDLKVDYTGSPYVNYEGDYPVYDWESKLSIYLTWKAFPDDIKTELKIDNEDVSF